MEADDTPRDFREPGRMATAVEVKSLLKSLHRFRREDGGTVDPALVIAELEQMPYGELRAIARRVLSDMLKPNSARVDTPPSDESGHSYPAGDRPPGAA